MPSVASAASSGATAGIGLGQGIGEVAEDVRRVVELDELLGTGQGPPRAVGLLGDDLRAELAGRGQHEPLVVVVDDDEVTDQPGRAGRRDLELVEQSGFAALAALLVLEREVVQPSGGRLVVLERGRLALAGRPRVGGGRVGILAEADAVSSGEMPAASIRSPAAVGSSAKPAASRAASAKAP